MALAVGYRFFGSCAAVLLLPIDIGSRTGYFPLGCAFCVRCRFAFQVRRDENKTERTETSIPSALLGWFLSKDNACRQRNERHMRHRAAESLVSRIGTTGTWNVWHRRNSPPRRGFLFDRSKARYLSAQQQLAFVSHSCDKQNSDITVFG